MSQPQPIIFDSEGFSRAISRDLYIRGVVEKSYTLGLPVIVSAATIVEVIHPNMNQAAYNWTRSRLDIIPVSEEIAVAAAKMLMDNKMHGHKHAIDALVAATALVFGGHPTIFTSDPDDFRKLVGKRASIVALR